jgi:hypothetical protein
MIGVLKVKSTSGLPINGISSHPSAPNMKDKAIQSKNYFDGVINIYSRYLYNINIEKYDKPMYDIYHSLSNDEQEQYVYVFLV